MDVNRFDAMTRVLTLGPSRRRVLGLLVGSGIGTLLVSGAVPADAKKKGRRGKKKKKRRSPSCGEGQTRCQGQCLSSDQCCTAADCGGGMTCQNTSCVCSPGIPLCPVASTSICCTPPPGLTVKSITCGALGDPPVPTCVCSIRAGDHCPGCANPECIV